jgi:hypothetical protein
LSCCSISECCKPASNVFWLHDPLGELLDESQRGLFPLQMPDATLIPPNIFLDPGT